MLNKELNANLISEKVFDNWSIAWKELEFDQKPYEFFKREEGLITAAVFDAADMTSLISTIGVSTVKVRFGLDEENRSFQILLFGTDNTGQILTPYYVQARNVYSGLGQEEGEVPIELINQWKRNWIVKGSADEISNKSFLTPYGFTRGYNYPLKEFIQTLFKFEKAPDILIEFVLHEYYGVNYLTTKEMTSTFGVVLHGNDVSKGLDDGKDGGYYDLTAPCPRTC